jgi:hypothetical protein
MVSDCRGFCRLADSVSISRPICHHPWVARGKKPIMPSGRRSLKRDHVCPRQYGASNRLVGIGRHRISAASSAEAKDPSGIRWPTVQSISSMLDLTVYQWTILQRFVHWVTPFSTAFRCVFVRWWLFQHAELVNCWNPVVHPDKRTADLHEINIHANVTCHF